MDTLVKYFPNSIDVKKSIRSYREKLINYGEGLKMEKNIIVQELMTVTNCVGPKRSECEVRLSEVETKYQRFESKAVDFLFKYGFELHKYFDIESENAINEIGKKENYSIIISNKDILFGDIPKDITKEVLRLMYEQHSAIERESRWQKFKAEVDKKCNLE